VRGESGAIGLDHVAVNQIAADVAGEHAGRRTLFRKGVAVVNRAPDAAVNQPLTCSMTFVLFSVLTLLA